MSHRTGKKKREKRREDKAEAEAPKKRPFLVLTRRRFALAALAGALTMVLMALLGGRIPPRITIVNRTGEPINDLKITYPGGTVEADPIAPDEKASYLLTPDPKNFKRPGSEPILLTYRVGQGLPGRFFSRAHGQDYGAHDVITIVRDPEGKIIVDAPPGGSGGVSFRDLLRRVGIRL